MIKLQLNSPQSHWIHTRMMLIMPLIVRDNESLFDEYGQFFEDYNGRDDKTCFAIKLKDNSLPLVNYKNEYMR